MDELVAAGVDYLGAVLQGVQHDAEAAIAAETHWPEPGLGLDGLAQLQALGVDHADAAVVAIGHVHRIRQWRIGHRKRVRAGLHGFQQLARGHLVDAQGAAVAVADEGAARIAAEGDLVVAGAAGQEADNLEVLGVDHRHPALALLAGVVADPQVALVRLQGHAHRVAAGVEGGHHLEFLGVDDGDLVDLRHADEHPLAVGGAGPVHRHALQADAGHGAGGAADQHGGVDHRQAGVLVQHQQVVAVQVEHRAQADAVLQVEGGPGAAFLVAVCLRQAGLRLVEPGAGSDARQRLAGVAVGDAELHVGERAFGERAAIQWLGFEYDGYAVAHQLLFFDGGRRLGCRSRFPGVSRAALPLTGRRDGNAQCEYSEGSLEYGVHCCIPP
ncbi:hypothetical protein D3C81_972250 [compost metagenome]